MKYIIVSVSTGKQVPALDICGAEHWEPLPMRQAAAVPRKATLYDSKALA